jgi:hypothetical protein
MTDAPIPIITKQMLSYCKDEWKDSFPCDQGSIVLVSLGLAAAGLGLLMVVFLMNTVRYIRCN